MFHAITANGDSRINPDRGINEDNLKAEASIDGDKDGIAHF